MFSELTYGLDLFMPEKNVKLSRKSLIKSKWMTSASPIQISI